MAAVKWGEERKAEQRREEVGRWRARVREGGGAVFVAVVVALLLVSPGVWRICVCPKDTGIIRKAFRPESADSGFNTQNYFRGSESENHLLVTFLRGLPLPGTGHDGGYVAAPPELWHICVFIEAGGMELGKLGGGCVPECVCVHPWDWSLWDEGGGGRGGHSKTFMCVRTYLRVWNLGKGRESRDETGESAARERGKLQIRLYLQISCQKEPFKGNAPVPALWQARCLFKKQETTMNLRER